MTFSFIMKDLLNRFSTVNISVNNIQNRVSPAVVCKGTSNKQKMQVLFTRFVKTVKMYKIS